MSTSGSNLVQHEKSVRGNWGHELVVFMFVSTVWGTLFPFSMRRTMDAAYARVGVELGLVALYPFMRHFYMMCSERRNSTTSFVTAIVAVLVMRTPTWSVHQPFFHRLMHVIIALGLGLLLSHTCIYVHARLRRG